MRDVDWLLLVFALVGVFTVYELFGVDPRFKHLHTISYYAAKHHWLAFGIGFLFGAGGVLGILWWIYHLGIGILK